MALFYCLLSKNEYDFIPLCLAFRMNIALYQCVLSTERVWLCTNVFCPQNEYGFVALCYVLYRTSMTLYHFVLSTERVWLCSIVLCPLQNEYDFVPMCFVHRTSMAL